MRALKHIFTAKIRQKSKIIIHRFIYWQFLRFKYIVNQDTKNTFTLMNGYVDRFKSRNDIPDILKIVLEKVQQFACYMGKTETTEGQAAGAGQNCNIFC